MSPEVRKHKVRTRIRHRRRLKFTLLCLGLTSFVLGLGLFVYAVLAPGIGRRFTSIGLGYLVAALVLLGVRQLLIILGEFQKSRSSRPLRFDQTGHALRTAPAPTSDEDDGKSSRGATS
jgi:hypothetical protein